MGFCPRVEIQVKVVLRLPAGRVQALRNPIGAPHQAFTKLHLFIHTPSHTCRTLGTGASRLWDALSWPHK